MDDWNPVKDRRKKRLKGDRNRKTEIKSLNSVFKQLALKDKRNYNYNQCKEEDIKKEDLFYNVQEIKGKLKSQ